MFFFIVLAPGLFIPATTYPGSILATSRSHLVVGSLWQTQFSSSHSVLSWTSSFVVPMALMSRLTQSIHLCFGLFAFFSHVGTISRVFLPTYSWSRLLTCPNHPNLAFLLLSVMFSTLTSLSLSLMSSFLTWYLSVWPHDHLHIFISVISSFFTFTRELVIGTVSIPYSNSIAGRTINLWIFPFTCGGTLLSL